MGLLSALGGLVGFAMGGPAGAALGSGIGSLAGGGDIGDALKAGVMGYVGGGALGQMGAAGGQGIGSLAASMGIGAQGAASTMNPLSQLGRAMTGGNAAAGGAAANQMSQMARSAIAPGMGQPGGAGLTSLFNLGPQGGGGSILSNPMVQALALQAMEPSEIKLTTPYEDRQLATGERRPDYRGTQAMDIRARRPGSYTRRLAQGGYIEGPGTGTSDSIPAQIYQNGMPVQEAALSDGEFVLREKDVNAIGGGDPGVGAARLYALQRQFDQGGLA